MHQYRVIRTIPLAGQYISLDRNVNFEFESMYMLLPLYYTKPYYHTKIQPPFDYLDTLPNFEIVSFFLVLLPISEVS